MNGSLHAPSLLLGAVLGGAVAHYGPDVLAWGRGKLAPPAPEAQPLPAAGEGPTILADDGSALDFTTIEGRQEAAEQLIANLDQDFLQRLVEQVNS